MQFPHNENVSQLDYSNQALKNLKGLSIASLNICSITRKIDELKILLDRTDLDIRTLNETFLNDSIGNEDIAIPGYKHFRLDRTTASGKVHGGGLLVYAEENRIIDVIEHGCFITPNLETCG